MDLDEYARRVRQSGKGKDLDALARSPEGARLAASVDREKLEKAAKAGDMRQLGELLQGILATPEGRSFAAKVRKAVEDGGR